jgi:hypothetical protein
MTLAHSKMNGGKPYIVPGITHLKTNEEGQISYHRDYYDAGQMLYEQIPLIRNIIRLIKRRL